MFRSSQTDAVFQSPEAWDGVQIDDEGAVKYGSIERMAGRDAGADHE